MTDKLRYMVELGIADNANVEEIEELMQEILLNLYDQGEVGEIRVTKDGYTTRGDVAGLLDAIDDPDSSEIRKAIDSARELEDMDDTNDDE